MAFRVTKHGATLFNADRSGKRLEQAVRAEDWGTVAMTSARYASVSASGSIRLTWMGTAIPRFTSQSLLTTSSLPRCGRQREKRMTMYLTAFSYAPETWRRLEKNPEDRRLQLTTRQTAMIFWATIVVVPLLLFGNAFRLYWKRR